MQTTKLAASLAGKDYRNVPSRSIIRFMSQSKLYELRIYQMKPEHFTESVELLAKYWQVRIAHSKAVGSWKTEIGGIAETVHLWEYDSLEDRMQKRLKVAADPVWTKEFWPSFFPKALNMTTYLLSPSPNTVVDTCCDKSTEGLYELLACEPRAPSVKDDEKKEKLIGRFQTLYGPTSTDFLLLRYADANTASQRALKRRQAEDLRGYSRLLVPCSWSGL